MQSKRILRHQIALISKHRVRSVDKQDQLRPKQRTKQKRLLIQIVLSNQKAAISSLMLVDHKTERLTSFLNYFQDQKGAKSIYSQLDASRNTYRVMLSHFIRLCHLVAQFRVSQQLGNHNSSHSKTFQLPLTDARSPLLARLEILSRTKIPQVTKQDKPVFYLAIHTNTHNTQQLATMGYLIYLLASLQLKVISHPCFLHYFMIIILGVEEFSNVSLFILPLLNLSLTILFDYSPSIRTQTDIDLHDSNQCDQSHFRETRSKSLFRSQFVSKLKLNILSPKVQAKHSKSKTKILNSSRSTDKFVKEK